MLKPYLSAVGVAAVLATTSIFSQGNPAIAAAPTAPAAQCTRDYEAQHIGQQWSNKNLLPEETSTVWIDVKNVGCLSWGGTLALGTWGPVPGQDQPSAIGGPIPGGNPLCPNAPATGWQSCNRISPAYTPVAPGQIVRFNFTVKAPVVAATYKLHLNVVIDGVAWTPDIGMWIQVTVAPPVMISEYIYVYTQPYLEDLGYSEGQGWGTAAGVVVLAFGEQATCSGGGRGVYGFDQAFHCHNEIAGLTEAFARGFYRGLQAAVPGSIAVTRIAMGTNNGNIYHNTASGESWGTWIENANFWLTDVANNGGADYTRNVTIWAADDIEPGFSPTSPNHRAFLDGYATTQTRPILNFGDCPGCPTTYTSGNPVIQGAWTLDDIWYASWGALRAWPLPEIYFTNPVNMGEQWRSVSLYSIITKQRGALGFYGSFSQWTVCQQQPTDPHCNSGGQPTLDPAAAWQALYNALYADTRTRLTPPYSTDVRQAS